MPFVIDASVAASWLLPNEGNLLSELAYDRLASDYAIAPSLWWFEMRNLFITNERRKRISNEQTQRALTLLSELPIKLDHATDEGQLFKLARLHRLTIYDAAYLELAQRGFIPLATLDKALMDAARAEHVPLVDSVSF